MNPPPISPTSEQARDALLRLLNKLRDELVLAVDITESMEIEGPNQLCAFDSGYSSFQLIPGEFGGFQLQYWWGNRPEGDPLPFDPDTDNGLTPPDLKRLCVLTGQPETVDPSKW